MPKHIVILAISIIGASVAYCTEYNPTNFKITVKQELCAGNRKIELPLSRYRSYGGLKYAVKVDLQYPPFYILIEGNKKYVKSIKFELYKKNDINNYFISYDIDVIRDSFFSSQGFISISHNDPINEKKVDAILAQTPSLNLHIPGTHGWKISHLSCVKTIPENKLVLKSIVELLNTVLTQYQISFDEKDLDAEYTSWLSSLTWRRKILGL